MTFERHQLGVDTAALESALPYFLYEPLRVELEAGAAATAAGDRLGLML